MPTPTQEVQQLADPFGQVAPSGRSLARKLPNLDGRRVVLFNNSKLDPQWGQLGAIYELLEGELKARFPGAEVIHFGVDLLGPGKDPLGTALAGILSHQPAAVVLALADIGVSQRTVELALQLEQRGIGTCVIAAPPGGGFARAVASAQLPGLAVVELAVSTFSSRQEVIDVAQRHVQELILCLTGGQQPAAGAASASMQAPQIPPASANKGTGRAEVTAEQYYEALTASGLGDGLPVLLPTRDAVLAMLAAVGRKPDEVLFAGLVPSGIPVTVERLAANAVMAGCKPDWFPVVLAAFEAMTAPGYRLAQAAITTHPGANLIMVSGPLAEKLGISGGAGCLGPGNRANLTIGRALTLTLINVGRIRPGEADLASFGSAGEIGCCFAENLAASPWPAFHVDHYDRDSSCVVVHRAEFPHGIADTLSTRPEPIMEGIASVAATLGGNNTYNPAELIVLLNPEHARMIAKCGWSKQDIQRDLFERVRLPAARLAGRGLPSNRARRFAPDELVPVVDRAEDIIVVVAGGPGTHSMVAVPWGARLSHRVIPTR